MRPPLEYGDNFPVPPGSWNPAVPWRFPNTEFKLRRLSALSVLLPWLTLGLGMTLGILWMNWRTGEEADGAALQNAVPVPASEAVRSQQPETRDSLEVPKEEVPPVRKPVRMRSKLA